MNIVRKRVITLLLGIIFLAIALVLNTFNLFRAILALLSIILIVYSMQLERTNKKLFITLFTIVLTFFVIGIDYLNVCIFKKTPIITTSIITNNHGSVYNSIGYRVWKCNDNDVKVDPLYKIGYYCEVDYMSAESINNVLPTIVSNFDHYKNNYVKIIGRVNSVDSDSMFSMRTYKEIDNVINYSDEYLLEVNFNYATSKISELHENDIVTVTGRVENKYGNKVTLVDAKFKDEITSQGDVYFNAESNIYCEYDKELWFQTEDNLYYRSCINDVNITINNRQYNLLNAISTGVITLQQIENESLGYESQNKDNSIMYKYKDFNILVCDPSNSRDVIVGRTTMSFTDGYCNNVEENRGV